MMSEIFAGIFEVLFVGSFIWYVWDNLRTDVKVGKFTLNDGHVYIYQIGNHVARYGAPFKGIQTELPKFMPHIYIDAHNGDHGRGMRFYAKKGQMVQLEGDFNTYFQAYVPAGQQVLALSVLTPDVMQTLIAVSDRYDVEIVGQTLRLLTHKRPYKNAAREADLVQSLTTLTEEINHRLQSWTDEDVQEAMTTNLITEDDRAVKFGRRSVRLSTVFILSAFGTMGLLFWAVTLYAVHTNPHISTRETIESLVVCFLFFPVFVGYLLIAVPRGGLNWIGRLLDRFVAP